MFTFVILENPWFTQGSKFHPVFFDRRQTILTTMHLHYTVDSLYKWEGWMVTKEDDEAFGYIANQGDSLCPLGLNGGWEYQLSSGWEADDTLQVSCGDDGPTDGPGPTDGQDTTTSDKPTVPGPGGMQPTIVAIKVRSIHVLCGVYNMSL